MPISTRLARVDEIEAVQAVEVAAATMFDGTGLLDGISGEPADTVILRDAVAEHRLWVAVADERRTGERRTDEGRVVGFALAIWCGGDAHLQELDVLPAWGRRGIGRRLVAEVIGWAARLGRERVTLTTFADVPWNAPFYARLGFSVLSPDSWTDALRDVWEHEREIGLPMEARVVMRAPVAHRPIHPGSTSG